MTDSRFRYFQTPVNHKRPAKFTFPYVYDPHPLAEQAVDELQDYIQNKSKWEHDFGVEGITERSLGKMFGVLVVESRAGELGYLMAYSGKLDGPSYDDGFAPNICDQFHSEYYLSEIGKLGKYTEQIKEIESDATFIRLRQELADIQADHAELLAAEKRKLNTYRRERKAVKKSEVDNLTDVEYQSLLDRQSQESINDQFVYRELEIYLQGKVATWKKNYDILNNKVKALRERRHQTSKSLQEWLFKQYTFLSYQGDRKNVKELFQFMLPQMPPSGAGDCAAPKLFQYAFSNGYMPIAMAEFWWGKSPNSVIRKHGNFYPACRGKCKPILEFMLEGLPMDPNPLLDVLANKREIEIVFEDEHIIVLNKPHGILSVPGKEVTDSVQERLLKQYPSSTGPMIVHRLDMSTSGLMVAAKTKDAHKHLQDQFKVRKVKKRYVAVLDGLVEGESGYINLPLRVDLDNRPNQMVCNEHGKNSRTKWEIISRNEGRTKVYFYPTTGRTHQLRVHAAHHMGLDAPIIGDMLYGKKKDRLYLHAETLSFRHPVSEEMVSFTVAPDFL